MTKAKLNILKEKNNVIRLADNEAYPYCEHEDEIALPRKPVSLDVVQDIYMHAGQGLTLSQISETVGLPFHKTKIFFDKEHHARMTRWRSGCDYVRGTLIDPDEAHA